MTRVLVDQPVVVTGAGSGIGRATAIAFARAGARLAVCDIDQARLDDVARALGDRLMIADRVDVADRAQMAAFAAHLHREVRAAHVVVNNAGVSVGGPFLDTSLDDWDWLLGVNLRGVVHGCHFFVPNMVAAGAGGQVINLSSILGLYAAPDVSAYVASKFAVRGFSGALRAELAVHGIGVSTICPGMVATAMCEDSRMAGAMSARRFEILSTFRDRGTSPETVAAAIVDAVHANPVLRPVGLDAWAIHAFGRIAPRTVGRVAHALQRRFGGA